MSVNGDDQLSALREQRRLELQAQFESQAKAQADAEAEAKRYRRQPEEDEGEQGGEDDDMSPKLPELRLNRLRFVRSMQYFEKLRNPQEAKAINRLFSSFDVTISDSIDLVELCLYCRDMAILRPVKQKAVVFGRGNRR